MGLTKDFVTIFVSSMAMQMLEISLETEPRATKFNDVIKA
jgi:hypothetical protein